MGIEEVVTAYRSPWQNAYSERLNGSIRRECLDRVIIFSGGHLRRVLKDYFEYYNRYRVHQSLEMDAPAGRETQNTEEGDVIGIPHVGGFASLYAAFYGGYDWDSSLPWCQNRGKVSESSEMIKTPQKFQNFFETFCIGFRIPFSKRSIARAWALHGLFAPALSFP